MKRQDTIYSQALEIFEPWINKNIGTELFPDTHLISDIPSDDKCNKIVDDYIELMKEYSKLKDKDFEKYDVHSIIRKALDVVLDDLYYIE